MIPFEYVRATDVAGAVAAGSAPGAAYLAAGTNLLDLMKGGVARPTRLVDITRLPGLAAVERRDDGGLRIGALARNSDLAHDPAFAKAYPAVAEALLSGASAQLHLGAGGDFFAIEAVRGGIEFAARRAPESVAVIDDDGARGAGLVHQLHERAVEHHPRGIRGAERHRALSVSRAIQNA